MDQNIKERKNPVLAIISIACTSLALLLIILGLVCILHLSQIDNNWGMIIVGLIFLIVPGVILGIIATIIAIISLIRKEKLDSLRQQIESNSLSARDSRTFMSYYTLYDLNAENISEKSNLFFLKFHFVFLYHPQLHKY